MFIDSFIKKIIDGRKTVLFLLALVILYGMYSYYNIPKQENPKPNVAAAVITTVYPGASPEEVEENVTKHIENQLKTIPEIDYFTSMNMNSASVVAIMYDLDVSMEEVETQLRRKIEEVQSELPDMCMESMLDTDLVPTNQFIISLSSESFDSQETYKYAEKVKSALEKVNGVESVVIDGEKTKQVTVQADIEKMQLYGISIENILGILQAQNLSIPSGSINYDTGKINVITPAVFESLSDIENTVIGGAENSLSFVKIKDVAEVFIEEDNDIFFFQDGLDAILVTGTFKDGMNAINIGKDLRKSLDTIKQDIPEEINFHEVMYAPKDIEFSINNFIKNLIESVLLIVLVVMIGVQLRNGLVISIAIPTSIFITFIIMNVLNIEFQFISITALIVSLGILVDNAIVVSEEIQHNINIGMDRLTSVQTAVKSTAMPVFTSTLTTVVTFSTIYFIPGSVGQVAGTIPTVVISALTASYFVAMIIIPVLGYMFFKPEAEKENSRLIIVKRFFDGALELALKYKKTTIILAFSTLLVAGTLAMQLGVQFFPYANKPVVYINVEGESLSIDNTNNIAKSIGDVLTDIEMVENYTSSVGEGLPSFFLTVPNLAPADNVAQFMLQLDQEKVDEYDSIEDVARYLQAEIDSKVAGANISVKCLEYSIPTDAKITLIVTGEDVQEVNRVANELTEALSGIEGTDDVRNTIVQPEYQYKVNMDSQELSNYGLIKYDVVKQINTSLMGATASTYTASENNMDIVVKSNVESLEDLKKLPINSSVSNTKIVLEQIADITVEPAVPMINHYNGQYNVNVLSGVLSGYKPSTIENVLADNYYENINIDNVEIDSRGEVKNMLDLIVSLGISAMFAVCIMYVILLLQFKDFKKPLNILSSIPLSLIGCGLGLWILQMDIQALALLGLVSLFGIVVNNGILLLEVIDAQIATGVEIEQACKQAVGLRYRPIMLSSITTCIGLVPLIIAGDPMTAPMATTLLFGLLFSTGLTMVVVPTLYSLTKKI